LCYAGEKGRAGFFISGICHHKKSRQGRATASASHWGFILLAYERLESATYSAADLWLAVSKRVRSVW